MNLSPQTILAIIELLTELAPLLSDLKLGGTVSVADQERIRDAYLKFREAGDAAFSGPEWQDSSETGPNPTGQ